MCNTAIVILAFSVSFVNSAEDICQESTLFLFQHFTFRKNEDKISVLISKEGISLDNGFPIRLLPTLPMLAESLREEGWHCEMNLADESQHYRGIRLYHPRQALHRDVLYLLRPEERDFPVDEYSYLSAAPHSGKANHLTVPEYPDEEILDQLLEIFSQFQAWEDAMDTLLYRSASLQELCELGARQLGNPVCVHDDWFVMMAMTPEFARVMEPEYLMTSAMGFVPRAVVEDFQDDSDYLETYAHHGARIWHDPARQYKSMYVNLWDGPVYKGRLLVAPENRGFLCRDFLLAEALTQRAVFLLRRKQLGSGSIHRNMDEIVFSLLKGATTEPSDLANLLDMLGWQRSDQFLCLRLRPQQGSRDTVMEHLLHGELFRCFPGSYVLLDGQEQCVVVDLRRSGETLSQLRRTVAPLCRDYCLYVGISSPVSGVRELQAAYCQAGAALDRAFLLRSEKWVLSFSECALDHLVQHLPPPLSPLHLAAPELLLLRDHDREHGTAYFDTLRAYLLQERDIPRTSEALIIHRTTLLYRLKKIQSLIHTDLDDPWKRLYWTLSLWLLENGAHGQPV